MKERENDGRIKATKIRQNGEFVCHNRWRCAHNFNKLQYRELQFNLNTKLNYEQFSFIHIR